MLTSRTTRSIARWAIVLAGATSLVLTGATSSSASTSTCCRLFENQDTHLRLDDSFEYGLRAYPYNGSNFQRWNITHWNDNTWEMKNVATGRCIDDSFEYGLRTLACNSSKYQSWFWHMWGDGTMQIQNQKTERCLDNYFDLRPVGCDASPSQSWL